ncbi:N-acyl homoserine lactonase family protein [Glycomyces sp. NRRL B-16210]|uniref:N-acyl homoserine lactonase family protein n=1 Tax=Glycomyces sp. NRRL B-16210 TaxID=1463821 RepID=UPI0004C0A82F|nr:N-acyl homoserine lactonase family protein [Glycomyces sp. NRRL B-16210]
MTRPRAGPIGRVRVLSTGTVAIRPEQIGPTRKPVLWWLLTSTEWTAPKPVNVFVVEHREGLVLFDTGQDRASVTDPGYFPSGPAGLIYSRIAKPRMDTGDTLPARLAELGHDTGDVRRVVLSHLHHDHIGGLPHLGHAQIHAARAELDSLARPFPRARGLLPDRIDLPGLQWKPIDFAPIDDPGAAPFTTGLDLYGDGSILLLPTPGHTPGSTSMLVRRPGRRPLLMVGDLTFDAARLAAGIPTGTGDKRRSARTAANVAALRARLPGLTVLAAHDPDAAALLEQAEQPYRD